MANGHLMLHERGRDEADWSLVLTLAVRKIPFCPCLIRQRRDLGKELGWNLVRFKKTGCSDSHLGFGTYSAPCVSLTLCAGDHGNTSGRQFLHGAPRVSSGPGNVPVAHGTAAQQRHTAAWKVTARVH